MNESRISSLLCHKPCNPAEELKSRMRACKDPLVKLLFSGKDYAYGTILEANNETQKMTIRLNQTGEIVVLDLNKVGRLNLELKDDPLRYDLKVKKDMLMEEL